jgi:glyoxylase-like metal-dependent hydrolase (beta-lactamase superfamily II)
VSLLERLDNIYLIDTKMFGFDHYNSAYLVEGKEIALVDTGLKGQSEAMLAGIKKHGFSISDISYIFITHSHPDHIGNVARILRESPRANVYIHPAGQERLIDPSAEFARWKLLLPPEMLARFEEMEPVPPSRIKYFNDGDVFDLGNGQKLRIIFAPGHQPDGIVIFEEKNRGLFINDLVGNCFLDIDSHYCLNPDKSDNIQAIETLKKLEDLPVAYLYVGHYGIYDKPKQVISRSIDKIQQLLDIGAKCMSEGKPESIADKAYEVILPELEKLRRARGEAVYQYATREHIPPQLKLFAKYCQERLNK